METSSFIIGGREGLSEGRRNSPPHKPEIKGKVLRQESGLGKWS